MSALALAAALALLASGPEQIQIDQIGTADAPGESAREIGGLQLGEATRAIEAPPPTPAASPVQQLNKEPARAAARETQPAPPPFQRPAQLNEQKATAEPPAGPPTPFPRRATVEAVSGQDACDPANPAAAETEACVDRIEARADEFAPPPRSAEDRLMARPEAPGADARAAARRLAEGDVQNSDAAQAYVYTSGLTAQSQTTTPQVSPQTQKALDAAAQLLGVLPAGAVVTTH